MKGRRVWPPSIGVVIEAAEVLQGGAVGELILIFGLHHGRSLTAQEFASGEEIHHAFVSHPLQNDGECDEDAGPADASAAVHRDRTVLERKMRDALNGER